MDPDDSPRVVSVTSCLTIIVFGMMIFIGLFFYFAVRVPEKQMPVPEDTSRALMTVIPAPTLTPTVFATKVPQTLEIHYVSEDGLSVGTVVEVYDTGSTGLSVRPQPGTGGYLNFVAGEGERFKIIDGPDSRNNYIWWKLESLTDPDRNGWAAADFLRPVR
ncbi:MAG: hypothetical protein IKP86_03395 [Anaerolineaceae bacterium]|nr:hypothetical protein [Anaerolineaceae bacterium]